MQIPSHPSLEFLRPIEWSEIFDEWREREAYQQSWQKHWRERGFDSWDEWRSTYIKPYRPETLDWSLYRISDPIKASPDMYGVPTDTWIRGAYDGKTTRRLRNIIDYPPVRENPKVEAIRKNFPKETMMIGLLFHDDIVLIEGMHRAVALATWNPEIPFASDVSIALAEWPGPELLPIGGDYKRK